MLTAAFGDLPSVDVSGQLDVLSQSLHDELAYEGVVLDDEYSHWRLLKFLDRAFLPTADALIAAGKRQNPE
jgi:hypothetical protein